MKLKVLLTVFLCIIMSGCSDDFDKFERNKYDISTNIDNNIYVIDQIEDELDDIVAEYSDELKLTYAEYTFSNSDSNAMFHYKNDYSDHENDYVKTIDLYVDDSGKAYKAIYTDGRVNRVNDYPSNGIANKTINVLEIFKENGNFSISDNSYVKVILNEEGIEIKYYTDDSLVERKRIESNNT